MDREILRQHSDGLIATSACLKGEVNWNLLKGQTDLAVETARELQDIFGEGNFFLELQNHGLDPRLIGQRGEHLDQCPGPRQTPSEQRQRAAVPIHDVSLHGHHSNTPASLDAIANPDPLLGQLDMSIAMTIRDTRMFGPNVEVRRTITCTLGKSSIHIHDDVINRATFVELFGDTYDLSVAVDGPDALLGAFLYRGQQALDPSALTLRSSVADAGLEHPAATVELVSP